MATDDRWLEEAARAIANGDAVDWANVESDAGEGRDRLVSDLRLVARIADVHRRPTGAAQSTSAGDAAIRSLDGAEPQTWGPLLLLERVGGGAYGDVYRARDPRLDRDVALKLLRHEPCHEAADAVVVHEARVMARVRHPHVVTVYGADSFNGRVGLWMEFIRGRSLAQELDQQGPFDTEAVLRVGVDLCAALDAVHRAGLVHRDVKASNVMREENGRLVLMDFGTGCDEAEPQGAVRGALVGTPVYIAPEVLAGQPASSSADLYAAGVLLFHLATGTYPVTGTTLAEIRAAHDGGRRCRLRDLRPELPAAFLDVLDRAIAADPNERFQSAAEMQAALEAALPAPPFHLAAFASGLRVAAASLRPRSRRGRAVAAALGLLVMVPAIWYEARAGVGSAGKALGFAERDAVLVAAFENHTPNSQFRGAVEYALNRELQASSFLSVASTERVGDALQQIKRLRTTPIDETVGRAVCQKDGHIKVLITGAIEEQPTTFRITARLVSPPSGRAVWSARVDARRGEQLMPVVRQLAAQIRIGLGEPREDVERQAAPPEIGTGTLKAFQLFGEGMALLDLDSGDRWEISRAYFNQAIREDPDFALAYAYRSWTMPSASPERLADSERAFQLADRVDERARLFIRGTYFEQRNRRAESVNEYARLVQLAPQDYWAVNNLAYAYLYTGARSKSIPFFIRRAQLRPNSVTANFGMVMPLALIGQLSEAAHYANLARDVGIAHPPEGGGGREYLAAAELFPARLPWREGDMEKVAGQLREAGRRLDGHPARWELVDAMLNWYRSLGRLHDADDLALQQADARSTAKPAPSSDLDPPDLALAWNAYYRGDKQSARGYLVRLYTELPPSQQSFRAIILMARVGMVAQAKAIIAAPHDPDVAFSPPFLAYYDAEIALAQRRPADVVKLLDKQYGGPPVMCELALAAAHEARGDLRAALIALEHANGGSALSPNWPYWLPGLGAEWLQMQATKARLLRNLHRVAEAQAVEMKVRPLVAAADPDHPIVAYLNSMKGR